MTFVGFVAGLAMGWLLLGGVVLASMLITDCFKDCRFPVWPSVLIVCAPLIVLLLLDFRKISLGAGLPFSDLDWWQRRSFVIGMAAFTLSLNHNVAVKILRPLLKSFSQIPLAS